MTEIALALLTAVAFQVCDNVLHRKGPFIAAAAAFWIGYVLLRWRRDPAVLREWAIVSFTAGRTRRARWQLRAAVRSARRSGAEGEMAACCHVAEVALGPAAAGVAAGLLMAVGAGVVVARRRARATV